MEFKGSKTEANLKQAFASETYTYSEMYLGTVRTAREAGSTIWPSDTKSSPAPKIPLSPV